MKPKLLIFAFILCISCSSLDIWGYKSLGNHYFLWEADHYKYDIIWNNDDSDAKAGGALIIGDVVKYNYNENYIIVKTTEYNSDKDSINKFWFINKSQSMAPKNWAAIGPLDSIGFINYMKYKKIKLKLIDVPSH